MANKKPTPPEDTPGMLPFHIVDANGRRVYCEFVHLARR